MLLTVSFGPWAPDLANVPVQVAYPFGSQSVPCADCLNVYYADGTYKSLPNPANVAGSPAVTSQPVGAFTYIDPSGVPTPLVGTASSALGAYYWTGSAWATLAFSISSVGPIASWNFAQFGSQMAFQAFPSIIASSQQPLWVFAPSLTPAAVVAAPTGAVIATVGQFLMVGDIYGPATVAVQIGTGNGSTVTFTGTLPNLPAYPTSVLAGDTAFSVVGYDNGAGVISGAGIASGTVNYDNGAVSVTFSTPPATGHAINVNSSTAYRSRVQWSAIGNPSNWPVPLTNAALAAQSGRNDLEADLGPIMAICGYPLYAIILQRQGLTRAVYQGGNVVFSWGTYDRKRGLIARKAYVQVGQTVYFLSNEGFMSTDGATTTPIGTASDNSAGIDKWFWSNVNTAALGAITAGFDATLRCVIFAIPTGSNTSPDTVLVYNPLSGYWTRSAIASTMIWTDSDGNRHRLGVFSQNVSGSYNYELLTAAASSGYLETCDIAFTDGNTRVTTKVRPNIACTDTPTVTIGNRNTLQASVTYSSSVAPDSFGGGFAGVIGEGLYTRARVTSGAAQAIHGATLNLESGGAV